VATLRGAAVHAELNARPDTIGAKIRDAQMQKIPLMLVVGNREAEAETVAVGSAPTRTWVRCRSKSSSR
jgi:threonyl-tRNA synthetase